MRSAAASSAPTAATSQMAKAHRRRRLSVLERGAGDRQQPRLPDAARRASRRPPRVRPIRGPRTASDAGARGPGPLRRSQDDDHHRQAPLATHDPARPRRGGGAARARRDDAGAGRGRGGRPRRRSGWPSSTCRTASRWSSGRRPPRARGFELPPHPQAAGAGQGSDAGPVRPEHDNGNALGDGPGDHARAGAAFLTGVHSDKTAGADIKTGVSVDQIAAQQIGSQTRFASIELGCEDTRVGRQLRLRLQLRLHQQPVVAQRDHADAAGDQPARGLRAPVRRRRRPRSGDARAAPAHAPQHPRPRSASGARRCATTSAPAIAASWTSTSTAVREIEQRISAGRVATDQRSLPDDRAAERHPRRRSPSTSADVRPAGAGVPGRHHPHRDDDDRAARAAPGPIPRSASPTRTIR